MGDLFYDDYTVGRVFRSRGITITESDIIDFALRYDPQPFHIDTVAAEKSHFGGLIASGWQVAALAFRAVVDAGFLKGGGMGAPGIDDMKWHLPVRPGDTIRMEAEVIDRRLSDSRQDRGYVTVAFRAFNQKDDVIMTFRCVEIIARDPA